MITKLPLYKSKDNSFNKLRPFSKNFRIQLEPSFNSLNRRLKHKFSFFTSRCGWSQFYYKFSKKYKTFIKRIFSGPHRYLQERSALRRDYVFYKYRMFKLTKNFLKFFRFSLMKIFPSSSNFHYLNYKQIKLTGLDILKKIKPYKKLYRRLKKRILFRFMRRRRTYFLTKMNAILPPLIKKSKLRKVRFNNKKSIQVSIRNYWLRGYYHKFCLRFLKSIVKKFRFFTKNNPYLEIFKKIFLKNSKVFQIFYYYQLFLLRIFNKSKLKKINNSLFLANSLNKKIVVCLSAVDFFKYDYICENLLSLCTKYNFFSPIVRNPGKGLPKRKIKKKKLTEAQLKKLKIKDRIILTKGRDFLRYVSKKGRPRYDKSKLYLPKKIISEGKKKFLKKKKWLRVKIVYKRKKYKKNTLRYILINKVIEKLQTNQKNLYAKAKRIIFFQKLLIRYKKIRLEKFYKSLETLAIYNKIKLILIKNCIKVDLEKRKKKELADLDSFDKIRQILIKICKNVEKNKKLTNSERIRQNLIKIGKNVEKNKKLLSLERIRRILFKTKVKVDLEKSKKKELADLDSFDKIRQILIKICKNVEKNKKLTNSERIRRIILKVSQNEDLTNYCNYKRIIDYFRLLLGLQEREKKKYNMLNLSIKAIKYICFKQLRIKCYQISLDQNKGNLEKLYEKTKIFSNKRIMVYKEILTRIKKEQLLEEEKLLEIREWIRKYLALTKKKIKLKKNFSRRERRKFLLKKNKIKFKKDFLYYKKVNCYKLFLQKNLRKYKSIKRKLIVLLRRKKKAFMRMKKVNSLGKLKKIYLRRKFLLKKQKLVSVSIKNFSRSLRYWKRKSKKFFDLESSETNKKLKKGGVVKFKIIDNKIRFLNKNFLKKAVTILKLRNIFLPRGIYIPKYINRYSNKLSNKINFTNKIITEINSNFISKGNIIKVIKTVFFNNSSNMFKFFSKWFGKWVSNRNLRTNIMRQGAYAFKSGFFFFNYSINFYLFFKLNYIFINHFFYIIHQKFRKLSSILHLKGFEFCYDLIKWRDNTRYDVGINPRLFVQTFNNRIKKGFEF